VSSDRHLAEDGFACILRIALMMEEAVSLEICADF
jgi:hypothetical protein